MLTSLTDPLPRQSWAAVCRPASAWCPPAATPAAPSAPPTPWPCSARRGRGRSRWGPRAAGHIISILLVVRSPRTRGGWCRWCSGCGRSSRPWRPPGPSWRCPGTTSSKVDTAQRSIVCIQYLHPHDRRIPDAGGGAGQQTVHARPTHTGEIVSNCSQIFLCKYFLQMFLSQGECEDQLPAGQAGGQLEGDGGAGRGRGHVLQRILQGGNVIFIYLKVCC